MYEKLTKGIKTILDNYKGGIFDGKSFVFFSVSEGVVLDNTAKVMESHIAGKAHFTHSPVESRPHRGNIDNALEKNKEKLCIPVKYKCFPESYNKLLKDLEVDRDDVQLIKACIEFIKASSDTLLAKLLANYLLSESSALNSREHDLKANKDLLQKVSKLEIQEYFLSEPATQPQPAPAIPSGAPVFPATDVNQKDSIEDEKKLTEATENLAKFQVHQEGFSSEPVITQSGASYAPMFSSSREQKNVNEKKSIEEKPEGIIELLATQEAERQKLAEKHQRQQQELLLKLQELFSSQSKEKAELEVKQKQEQEAFLSSITPVVNNLIANNN